MGIPVFKLQTNEPRPVRYGSSARLAELSKLVGKTLHSELELANYVSNGITPDIIGNLATEGLTRKELAFVIPERTLTHRIQKGELLSRDESERGIRLANLLLLAEQVLGDKKLATEWLRQTKKRFDGATPLETAKTEQGARLVEALLFQIDEGYVA
ncbi:MbcA/ParS/Xre antitoxin family protein [Neisseriaceae bacterium TC5R-5]|nr:MbcA/ParS/Xre antitoxin family protein [Neisseriaceae bacterium TC5R-5]